ncbi:MAG: glycerophosphodiester phosphodiesterase [Actinobacteria bacterium]|nr:glycerophosphodiester phosphodiesterase [Actinomycetota bacterium]
MARRTSQVESLTTLRRSPCTVSSPSSSHCRWSSGFVGPVDDITGDNPWLERRVLHIAHQGGETEAPSNTLFALETALEKGADVLEIDVHATEDRELVVIHDTTVDRTTNGSGRVDQKKLDELKQLDAAYWFVPGCGACPGHPDSDYVYRGYATEERSIPEELGDFEPNDFTIPSLREVLERFPDTMINIEIKRSAPETGQTAGFFASTVEAAPGAPNPRYEALQVPITYEGIQVVTEDFVADAHANGLAVHVWTIGDREEMEWLIGIGVDGIMTDVPSLLEEVLAEQGVRYEPHVPPGRDVCRENANERARDRCGGQDG